MLATGLIYRNPKPHLGSRQASFPSLVRFPNGDLLAAFALGSGFESIDQQTMLARSHDDGHTWVQEGPLLNMATPTPTSSHVRISRMPNGELLAFGARWDRSRVDEGLTNPDNLGFVETELLLLRSADDGHSWAEPSIINPPLRGPSFEICSPVLALPDGRLLIPTATWKGWDGTCPNGMFALAFVSEDGGQTWPTYVTVMDGRAEQVIYWEQKIVDLGDGRVLAVCWTHDLAAGSDRQVHYALSHDGGRTFGPPRPTGLHGQTTTPIHLGAGRLVCIYRRTDQAGLWAVYVNLIGDTWVNGQHVPLWGQAIASDAGAVQGASLSASFASLRFGLPAGLVLPDGTIFAAFWGVEDCVSVIRWFRLPATPSAS